MAYLAVRYAGLVAAGGCGVAVLTDFIRDTFYVEQKQDSLARFDNFGEKIPFSKHTEDLIEEVSRRAIPSHVTAPFTYFTCTSQDPVNAGSTCVKWGAAIGLPTNIDFTSPSDINKCSLTIGKEYNPINWDCEDGRRLEEALILSDQAKKFMIGREIAYGTTCKVYADLFIGLGSIAAALSGMNIVNDVMNIQKRFYFSPMIRTGFITLTGFFFVSLYFQLQDIYHYLRDRKVNVNTARLSSELAQGGVEFYEKMIQRNQAIRSLMGENGVYHYTVDGEAISQPASSFLNLYQQKTLVEKCLQEFELKK